jgi:hypothetical protein
MGCISNVFRPALTVGSPSPNRRASASVLTSEHRHAKSSISRQHWTEKQNLACLKSFLKIAAVLVHQSLLLTRYVEWKRGTRRNQFEKVVLFRHGRV